MDLFILNHHHHHHHSLEVQSDYRQVLYDETFRKTVTPFMAVCFIDTHLKEGPHTSQHVEDDQGVGGQGLRRQTYKGKLPEPPAEARGS